MSDPLKETEVILRQVVKGRGVSFREGKMETSISRVEQDGTHFVETLDLSTETPRMSSMKSADLKIILSSFFVMVEGQRKALWEILEENELL